MRRRPIIVLLASIICAGSSAFASDPLGAAAPPPGARPAGAAAAGDARESDAPESHVSVLSAEQVIQILDDTVDWYRTLGTQQQHANQPSDLLILFANRQTADKVVALAFEIARANAELLSSEAGAGQSAAAPSSPQALNERKKQLDAQRQSIQDEISTDRQRAASSATGKQAIAAKLPELQGELAMVEARKNLLDTMADFVNESDPKGAGASALKAHIDAIAATIPAASGNPPAAAAAVISPPGASAAASPTALAIGTTIPERYGIWDLGSNVLKLRGKIKTIDVVDQHTAALAATFFSTGHRRHCPLGRQAHRCATSRPSTV
jgi:hypothetical protein